jgi:hypothetical protein
MKEKIVALLSSPRFIGLVLIGALQALVLFNVITGVQGEGLTQIIQSVILGAVAIKTVDRASEKVAGATANTTTVTMPKNVSSVKASKTTKKA